MIGTTLTLLGLGLVQAATACALVEIDEGRPVGPLDAYRLALGRVRPLLGAIAISVAVWVALAATAVLIPVAIWLAIRWSLLAQTVELEGDRGAARCAGAPSSCGDAGCASARSSGWAPRWRSPPARSSARC